MKTKYLVAIPLGILFSIAISCNDNPKTTLPTDHEEAAMNTEATSCFERYSTQYDKLLTKADISKQYPIDFAKAEKEYDTTNTSPSYEEMVYSWPSERTRTLEVMGNQYTLPVDNKIGVGSIRFFSEDEKFPLKRFKSMYDLSDVEKENAQKSIAKEVDKHGELDKPSKKTAKKLTGSILSNMKFTPVNGVGDAAVWDYMESGLIVLKGRTRFTVFVDVGTDHKKDVALAKELAKSILAKCE